jgi:hypothetical protein
MKEKILTEIYWRELFWNISNFSIAFSIWQKYSGWVYLSSEEKWNKLFQDKVWEALNNSTEYFNVIKKVTWGNTIGWRNRKYKQHGWWIFKFKRKYKDGIG